METLILEPSFNTVKTIPVLKMMEINIFARYYDDNYPSVKEQKAYEKNIFNKTCKTDSETVPLEGHTMAHKRSIDLYFYINISHEHRCKKFSTIYYQVKSGNM
uniref:Coatomer subunit zeta n=1 Tax=Prolemur simus TaxID=1328070 RepID=A0A8C8ZWU1_PROSS